MADNLQTRTPQDRDQINQHEEWEMEYWTKELGVSPQELKDAIAAVGTHVGNVRKHLGK